MQQSVINTSGLKILFPKLNFQNRIISLLSAGMKGEVTGETREKLFMAFMFDALAMLMMMLFTAEAMSRGDFLHGSILISLTILVIINFVIMRVSGNEEFFYNLTVWLMAGLCMYLLSTGGVDNTGPLWCYVFPLLALYLQGIKKGLISLALLMGFSITLFFIPDNPLSQTNYSNAFKMRFFATMSTVAALSYFYEFSRYKSYVKLQTLSQKFEEASLSDFLTGLANRRHIMRHIKHEKEMYARQTREFSAILCDIDHFKKVNDKYGHDCGDLVLKSVADILKDSLRQVDTVSRWGGEEFLIILPAVDKEGGMVTAERLRQKIEEMKIQCNNNVVRLTMSFGVATWDESHKNIDEFIKHADENLYRAKEEGRNRVIAF